MPAQIVNRKGFGKAVSRILSSSLRMERTICLSSRYPEPVPRWRDRSGPLRGSLFGLAPDGVFRAASLALRAVRSYRTFSPLPALKQNAGGLIFCGTVRRDDLRRRRPRVSQPHRLELRGIAPFGVRTFLPALSSRRMYATVRSPRNFENGFSTGKWKERGDSPPFQNHGENNRWEWKPQGANSGSDGGRREFALTFTVSNE